MITVIQAKRGDSLERPLTVAKDGVPLDLTSVISLVYLLKVLPSDADEDAIITFTTTNVGGIHLVVTTASIGQITLKAPPAAMLLPRARYFGFMQMNHPTYGVKEFSSDEPYDLWEIVGHGVLAAA